MGDEARTDTQDEAWKSKVRSVDETLKSLRSGDKRKPTKRPESDREQTGRGLFSFLRAKPAPMMVPIRVEPSAE